MMPPRSFSSVRLLGLLFLAALPIGCGPALGAGLGVWLGLEASKSENQPPAVVLGTIERWAGPVEIPVTVFDAEGDRVHVTLEYDLHDGAGFRTGTLSPESVVGSSGGTEETLIWEDPPGSPDYGYFGEIDLRLTPRDQDDTGSSVTTTILFGNDAPVVEVEEVTDTYVSTVPIFFTLYDSSSDSLEVEIEYKLEDGTTDEQGQPIDDWTPASFVPSVSEWPSAPEADGGLEHLVQWNAAEDVVAGYRGTVEVRVRGIDRATENSGVLYSNIDSSGEFFLRLNTPPVVEFDPDPMPGGAFPNQAYGYRVPIQVVLSDAEEDECLIQLEYRLDPSEPWRVTSIGGLFSSSEEGEAYLLTWEAREDLALIGEERFVGELDLRVRGFDTEFGDYTVLSEPVALNLGMVRPYFDLTDRDGDNATRFLGEEEEELRLGHSVAGLGDVNRNGYPDFAFGAPNHPQGGAVYLMFGGPDVSGPTTHALETWDPQSEPDKGVLITGEQSRQRFGHSIAALGDINGDGYQDFAIGAPQFNSGIISGDNHGAVYLAFGAQLASAGPEISADELWVRLVGEQANARLGYSVSGVGDVNGNGYDDILLGAHRHWTLGTFDRGRAYLLYGDDELENQSIDLGSLGSNEGMVITGEEGHFLGYTLSGVGDVNGNGFNDILVGAPNFENESPYPGGVVYLIYGDDDLPATLRPASQLDGDNGVAYLPPNNYVIGRTVAGLGDVTGSGDPDFIIGTGLDAHVTPFSTGRPVAYLVYGENVPSSASQTLSGPDGSTFTVLERDFSIGAMQTIPVLRGLGDVNGNGVADIGLGFPLAGSGAGATHVVYGRDDFGPSFEITLPDVEKVAVIEGAERGERLGSSLSALGDVDGNGYHAFLIGAPQAESHEHGAGYVVYGGPFTREPKAQVQLFEARGALGLRNAGTVPDQSTVTSPFTNVAIGWANGSVSTTEVTMHRDLSILGPLPTGVELSELLPFVISIDTNRSDVATLRLSYHEGMFAVPPANLAVYRADAPGSSSWSQQATVPFDDEGWYLDVTVDTASEGGIHTFIVHMLE